jgi:hypothetical protein
MFARNLQHVSVQSFILFLRATAENGPIIRILILMMSMRHHGLVPQAREDAPHCWLAHLTPQSVLVDPGSLHDLPRCLEFLDPRKRHVNDCGRNMFSKRTW